MRPVMALACSLSLRRYSGESRSIPSSAPMNPGERDFPFQFAVRTFSSVIAVGANHIPMSFGCQAISAPWHSRPSRPRGPRSMLLHGRWMAQDSDSHALPPLAPDVLRRVDSQLDSQAQGDRLLTLAIPKLVIVLVPSDNRHSNIVYSCHGRSSNSHCADGRRAEHTGVLGA